MKRRTLLAAVYNPIDFDGRVKRTCAALAADYDVTLLCLEGSGEYETDRYTIIRRATRADGGRVWRLLSFWLTFIRLALRCRPDIVYANDFFLPLPGWLAARLCGACFVYDAHELIVPTNGHSTTRSEALFYWLERVVVRRADLVIAANEERAAVMQDHYRLPTAPTPVRNIPPRPTARRNDSQVVLHYGALRRLTPGDVHVVYMGDMNLGRGLGVLLESLAFLPEHFKLIFVGTGPDIRKLREDSNRYGEGRLRIVGAVNHAEVFDVIRQADIGFVSYSMRSINEILCAPNKLIEYAQAGLPMVATCQPTIKNIFAAHPMGCLVGCNGAQVTPREVADALLAVARDRERHVKELEHFLTKNTWDHEAARLLEATAAACP